MVVHLGTDPHYHTSHPPNQPYKPTCVPLKASGVTKTKSAADSGLMPCPDCLPANNE